MEKLLLELFSNILKCAVASLWEIFSNIPAAQQQLPAAPAAEAAAGANSLNVRSRNCAAAAADCVMIKMFPENFQDSFSLPSLSSILHYPPTLSSTPTHSPVHTPHLHLYTLSSYSIHSQLPLHPQHPAACFSLLLQLLHNIHISPIFSSSIKHQKRQLKTIKNPSS